MIEVIIYGTGSGCVAQLVERSLPMPEVRGSTPVIGKIYWTFVYCQLYWKDENKEKRGQEWPIFLKILSATKEISYYVIEAIFSLRNLLEQILKRKNFASVS